MGRDSDDLPPGTKPFGVHSMRWLYCERFNAVFGIVRGESP